MDKPEREKLTEIIEAEDGTNWWQPALFEEHIRSQLPTDLKIISVPPSSAGNFNCFVYALHLEDDPEFLGGQNPIQKEFIRHLLNKGILQAVDVPSPGNLVFYEDQEKVITHGGIMKTEDLVLSKWMWGALFEHKLWDVPSSFGDKIFYTKPINPKLAKLEYEEYKKTGVEIQPIN